MAFETEKDGTENVSKAKRELRSINFTNQFVKNLKATGVRITYSDAKCTGLKLRLGATGTRTWAFIGRDYAGKNRNKTIGRYPDISIKDARREADALRAAMASKVALKEFLDHEAKRDEPTLLELLIEAETRFARTTAIWRPRGNKSQISTARQVITTVFGSMLECLASDLTAEKAALLVHSYVPKSGKAKANGQASRALAYLRTVFAWASHGTPRFKKIGSGRDPALKLCDLSMVHDPAVDDPEITGERNRVLSAPELNRLLPHLVIAEDDEADWRDVDLRPIAQRFILLTLARVEEVEAARKRDFDFFAETWTKTVKGNRSVTHPLSKSAIELIKSLPGFEQKSPDDLVFVNRVGNALGNWTRSKSMLVRSSGVDDWHRHDLRRTGATIMSIFGVPVEIVDTLLSHQNPMAKQTVSPAIQSYSKIASKIEGFPNLLRDAVEKLSEIIGNIEEGKL